MSAGKRTVANCLGRFTGLPVCSLDGIRLSHYQRLGPIYARGQEIERQRGLAALLEYSRPHWPSILQSILAENRGAIFDFGAEDSVAEGAALEELKTVLSGYPNIFMLMPSLDKQQCMQAIFSKFDLSVELIEINRKILDSGANTEIARHMIVREGMTVEQVARRVLDLAVGFEPHLCP
jgi:hypothetical protein